MKIQGPRTIESQQWNKPKKSKSNHTKPSRLNTSTSRHASLSLQSSKHFFLSKYIRLYTGKQHFKSPHCFSYQNILSNKIKIPTQKKTLPKTRQTSKISKTTIPRTRSLPSFCT